MFGTAARVAARPAVAAAAATAAANVAQGTAQARAPGPSMTAARAPAHVPTSSSCATRIVDSDIDGWLLTELQDEVVLFRPYTSDEVQDAANTVMALWSGRPATPTAGPTPAPYPAPIITEPPEEDDLPATAASGRSSASGSSDGRDADAAMEAAAADIGGAAGGAGSGGGYYVLRREERQQMEDLMSITTRLLSRPGMQREVVRCMMEDEEVRELMMKQCGDLDRYLLAAGFTTPHLLPPPEGLYPSAASVSSSNGKQQQGTQPEGPSLVTKLVGAVAGALERAGNALAALGGWLRRSMAGVPLFGAGVEAESEGGSGQGGEGAPAKRVNQVLRGVMVLAVAVFCVAVIRRPIMLRFAAKR